MPDIEEVTIDISILDLRKLRDQIEEAQNPKVIFSEDIEKMRKDVVSEKNMGLFHARQFIKKYIG